MTDNYEPIQTMDGRWTICVYWDEEKETPIVNDGICNYYFWNTEEEARRAANLYNRYEGCEWLGQHGYGNDELTKESLPHADKDMIELYRAFHAIDDEDGADE